MWANQESQRTWDISSEWMVINQAFAERIAWHRGAPLQRPPRAVPHGEARASERPPYPELKVFRVVFNRPKWLAITPGRISCAVR